MREMLDEFKEKPKTEEESDSEDRLETSLLTGKEKRLRRKEQFRERTAGMSKWEKTKYIIYYYKWVFICSAAAIVFVSYILIAIYKNTRPVSIACAVINPIQPLNVVDDPIKKFASDKELDKGTQLCADVYYNITVDYETSNTSENSRASALSLQCSNDFYDCMITDRDGLEFAAYSGIIYTLESTAGSSYIEKYKDRLYCTSDYSSPDIAEEARYVTSTAQLLQLGKRDIPVGINITGTKFVKDMNLGDREVYFCIATGKEKRIERACMFLDYILEEYE